MWGSRVPQSPTPQSRSGRDESEGEGRSGAAPLQGPGRKERETRRYTRLGLPGRLLGAASEETEDDAGGDPIVVLMSIRAERRAVEIRIEQTDVNVPRWVDIQPAADFEREAVFGSIVSAAPTDLGVRARSPDQGFGKWSQAPAVMPAVEVAGPIVIAIEHILSATDGYGVVAGVRDDLQPRFYVPTERPHCAVHVGPSSASTVQTSKGVAAKEFQQRRPANTSRAGSFPAGPRVGGPDRWCSRFGRGGLRLCKRVPVRLRDSCNRF